MHQDARGHAVTLSKPTALDAYERALHAFQTYRGDPLQPLDQALALDEGFAAAYATKALLLCTIFERRFMRDALAVLEQGRAAIERATPRERVLVDYPRDIVALQVAHIMDFFRGDSLNLRNRVSRVLPAWSESIPGYAYVLGMQAFGLEECNQYPDAERAGRLAVETSGDDCWAVRDGAARFGGSHAQRDLLSLTLIDAASRAGRNRLSRHYANERLVHKPASAWGRRLVRQSPPLRASRV